MINTNDFKIGQTIKLNNNIYKIMDFLHVKPGKGSAFVRSKIKNLKTGEIIEYTFNAGIKIETALITKKKLFFSYNLNDFYVFIDQQNYEEIEIFKNKLISILPYLTTNTAVEVMIDEKGEILDVSVPDKISLKVINTNPVSINNCKKNNSLKDATLETNLIVKVPLFIETGEKIIISTVTGNYLSRDTSK
ncbi:elongation factor P [Candidatus Phytoplasma palmae]|uniref:elongation factor P n=1 Tax=Candidatus Phytoplasma palmae TaxID=85624 RepID=UPI003990A177